MVPPGGMGTALKTELIAVYSTPMLGVKDRVKLPDTNTKGLRQSG